MARAPLLQLSGISLTFGGDPLFHGLDLVVQPGDRVALVGRNGSGKSTLMKVMARLVEPDGGTRVVPPGITVGYMEQHPEMAGFVTLGDFAASGLPEGEEYRVAVVAEGLKFDPETPVATASGGERRRAALAKLLAEAPELMLLDEPTNHLDIQAIRWLEDELRETRKAFVLIQPRPGVPAGADTRDPVDRPRAGAAAGAGVRGLRGLARQDLGRRGRGPAQAGAQDQVRRTLGGGRDQRAAQAQHGPGAGAGRFARRAGLDDPAAGHGRDGAGYGPEIRQAGDRGRRRYQGI